VTGPTLTYATTTLMIPDAFHAIVSVAPDGAVTVPPNRTYEINGFTPAPGVESYTTADVALRVPVLVQTALPAVQLVVWPFVIVGAVSATPPAVYPFAVVSSVHAVVNGVASKYLWVAAYVYAVFDRAHLIASVSMSASLFHDVEKNIGYMKAVIAI